MAALIVPSGLSKRQGMKLGGGHEVSERIEEGELEVIDVVKIHCIRV